MKTIVLGAIAIIILFFANLAWGSVNIPWQDVGAIISGSQTDETYRYILLESRLPAAIAALLSGAALATSGLLLQTAFRNPLAGPDVFGISSGAGLAVAIVMLAFGGNIALGDFVGDAGNYAIGGFLAILIAAFVGAMLVMAVITFFSAIVRSHTVLLIIGLMVGYLASSAISLLNFFSTAEGVKSYMVWGMGSFGNVSNQQMMFFIPLALIALIASLLLVKPLNAMLLGDQYAGNLGFNIRRLRIILLLITGFLTAVVTAFCGPIAFIGLATPHIARLLIGTENHRRLLPVTMLLGSVLALLCNLFCTLPSGGGIIPLNAVTPLFGAPVIIYVLLKRREGKGKKRGTAKSIFSRVSWIFELFFLSLHKISCTRQFESKLSLRSFALQTF